MSETAMNRPGYKLGPLQMVPGISGFNVAALLYGSFFGIAVMAFVGAVAQPYIFNVILEIPLDKQGSLAGNLAFVHEIVVLALIAPVGALSDKFGRKPLYMTGFILLGIGHFIYPLAQSEEQLMAFRLVLAAGTACNSAMLVAIANDYPVEQSRGKMIAAVMTFNALGMVLVILGLKSLPNYFVSNGIDPVTAGQYSQWTVSGICFSIVVVVLLGLKGGAPGQLTKREPALSTALVGLKAAKDPKVALAYFAAMVSRGDLAVVSTFFTLWLTQEGIAQGLSTAEAVKKAGMFYVLIQACALPMGVVCGFLLDKINRIVGLMAAMLIAGAGYMSLYFVDNPLGTGMYIAAVLVGMGEITANLSATTLIGQVAPVKGRGAVIGCFSFCGALGILIVAKTGGWLFDNVAQVGPFVLVGMANCAVFLAAVVVYLKTRNEPETAPAESAPVVGH